MSLIASVLNEPDVADQLVSHFINNERRKVRFIPIVAHDFFKQDFVTNGLLILNARSYVRAFRKQSTVLRSQSFDSLISNLIRVPVENDVVVKRGTESVDIVIIVGVYLSHDDVDDVICAAMVRCFLH